MPSSAIIKAVAGAGKTTTAVAAAKFMVGSNLQFLAFNKRIADELGTRLAGTKSAQAATFHSIGMRALSFHINARPRVADNKTEWICEDLNIPGWKRNVLKRYVSLLKQGGIGCDEFGDQYANSPIMIETFDHYDIEDDMPKRGMSYDELVTLACEILAESRLRFTKQIDFDDMLWGPILLDAMFAPADWIVVDEAQDTNFLRREMIARMHRPRTSRLMAIGDPAQAIYGFAGASSNSIDLIRDAFNCRELPLTVSYRCPRSVVEYAQQWVSYIETFDGAPEGEVRNMNTEQWINHLPSLKAGDAILCRLNAPLISFAFRLIRNNIPCIVEGRDIGRSVLKLIDQFENINSIADLVSAAEAYRNEKVNYYLSRKKPDRASSIDDKVDTLLAFCDGVGPTASIADLRQRIDAMFKDNAPSNSVILSSIHKSKGREWPNVYWIGKNQLQPHKLAKSDWAIEQEHNLMYVAATRAMQTLTIADIEI